MAAPMPPLFVVVQRSSAAYEVWRAAPGPATPAARYNKLVATCPSFSEAEMVCEALNDQVPF